MIIYMPKEIKNIEQVEDLPDGAIVIGVDNGARYNNYWDTYGWFREAEGYICPLKYDLGEGVKVIALIPEEAEIEQMRELGYSYSGPEEIILSRLTTEWREG